MTNEDRSKLLLETIPRTMRMIRAEMRRVAGDEFTIPQYRLLARLSRGAASNRELAEWMGVSAPTMSKMIDKLHQRGYVTRESEGSDRRQVALRCSPRGERRARTIRSAVQKTIAAKVASLPENKRNALAEGLLILRDLIP